MHDRDLRAETLYFIVTDRFHNGDPDNDLGDNPDCTDRSRENWLRYWGGDLQGIYDKLDYLAAIGVSAIWVSPIFDQIDAVANDEGRLAAPYHGYWAKDFKRIDEHLMPRSEWHRSFDDWTTLFDRLLVEAHKRGIRVLLDVVCNHTSMGAPNAPKGELYDDGKLLTTFDDDTLGWYNKVGPIRDWDSPHDLTKGELRGLADLNEDVWTYRRYITETMARWLDRGVDGFRLDAVKHMALSFWQEFTATMRKHKPDVILFGEWAGIGHWDTRGVHFANGSGMSVLDFGFQYAVQDILCKGQPWKRFVDMLHQDHVYDDATELVTFLDNHDMPRLLSSGMPREDLELGLALVMTSRGVPCIFYGTEQALHCDEAGGGDPYNRPMMESWDLSTREAKTMRALADLRRENLAIQRGFTREVHVGKDVFVYARGYGKNAVLVALNRGKEITMRLEHALLPNGEHRDLLGTLATPVVVDEEVIASLTLPASSAMVFAVQEPPKPKTRTTRARVVVRLNGYTSRYGERMVVIGDAPELGTWNPELAVPMHYVNANLWIADLELDETAGRNVLYRFAVIDKSGTIRHEDRLPRERFVPASGVIAWKDHWEH
jgi:cyclomaltodextrin glucanotransferase